MFAVEVCACSFMYEHYRSNEDLDKVISMVRDTVEAREVVYHEWEMC